MLYFAAEQRRQSRSKAQLIDAISTGYAGMRSKEGFAQMKRTLETLTKV